jgi:hypothetical protein
VECGTRALIDVVFDPHKVTENHQSAVLCRALRPDMLLLADRASDGYPLLAQAAAAGAQVLWRIQARRNLAVLHELPDGSYLSMVTDGNGRDRLASWTRRRHTIPPQVHGIAIRVIEAVVTATAADGSVKTGSLRLVTTLLDHHTYPAAELAALYHQRWEAETAFLGLKITLNAGRILRSGAVDDVRQEVFGLLIVYQAARHIGTQAAIRAGIDPDRISFTVTLRTARLTVIGARGTTIDPRVPLVGQIHTAVLHPRELGPKRRRARILPRRVKHPISAFAYGKSRHDKPMKAVRITVTAPQPLLTTSSGP